MLCPWRNKALIALLGLFFLAVAPLSIGADPDSYLVRTWMNDDGLPQSSVTSVVQTRDGYLWIGTFSGLVRFDGVHFTTFNTIASPDHGSDWITCLFEDSAGALWIGTRSGLACWSNGTLSRIWDQTPLGSKEIFRIVEPEAEHYLISTTDGLFHLHGGSIEEIPIPEPHWPTRQCWLTMAQDGSVWLGHQTDLYILTHGGAPEGKAGNAAALPYRPQLRTHFPPGIDSLHSTRDGALWIGLKDGTLLRCLPDGRTNQFHFPDLGFGTIYQTRQGTVWLGSQKGVYQWDGHGLVRPKLVGAAPPERIQLITEDREGTIWIGTDGGGLCRLDRNAVTMITTADGLGYDDTAALWQDRPSGSIWAGAFQGGLSRFESGKWSRVYEPGILNSNTSVSALARDRQGRLWIGAYGAPSRRMIGGTIEAAPVIDESFVRVLFEDRAGRMWMGMESGLRCYEGDTFEAFDTRQGLSHPAIRGIVEDRSGALWIGTEKGLNRMVQGKIESFYARDGLGGDFIQTLYLDAEGTLWIGSNGGGLTRFRDGRFSTITSRQGLFHDVVAQILEDDAGSFWIGSNNGIFQVSKKAVQDVLDGRAATVICNSFGRANGLRHPECAGGFQPSCLKASDGNLWFSTVGGIVVIDPRKVPANKTPPIVHIERVVLDGEAFQPPAGLPAVLSSAVQTDSGSGRSKAPVITIPPGRHRIEIHYTGLNFQAPAQVQFKYQLDGYDHQWQAVGTERRAEYKWLPPGHYRFRVMAGNNQGVWNETPAELLLYIQPLFHQTIWYRGLWAGAIAAGLFLFYRMRIDAVRRMEKLRLRIANDLHDEAGSNLGSIQLLSRRAAGLLARSEDPASELAEIQHLTATTAASIRDVVWLIDPEFDTLDQMLNGIETLAARLFAEIQCDVQWKVERRDRKLSIEFRTHFFLIIKEILHNIQKHAQATRVEIHLAEADGLFDLRVQDNGRGFDPALVATGHGLSSLKTRATQLAGHLEIQSRPGHGTTVHLKIKPT